MLADGQDKSEDWQYHTMVGRKGCRQRAPHWCWSIPVMWS